MIKNNTTIHLTLTTATGRMGAGRIGGKAPMVWMGEDDGSETVSVLFQAYSSDIGAVAPAAFRVSGDRWRDIDSGLGAERVLYWVNRGACLSDAVISVADECDPDGFDGEAEAEVDGLRDRCDALRFELSALVDACCMHGGTVAALAPNIAAAKAALGLAHGH